MLVESKIGTVILGMVTHPPWRLKQEYYEFEAILGEGVRLS